MLLVEYSLDIHAQLSSGFSKSLVVGRMGLLPYFGYVSSRVSGRQLDDEMEASI